MYCGTALILCGTAKTFGMFSLDSKCTRHFSKHCVESSKNLARSALCACSFKILLNSKCL